MGWPYHFVQLTDEQNHQRRGLLDLYGQYAQLSALVPLVLLQVYFGVRRVGGESRSNGSKDLKTPSSPALKQARTLSWRPLSLLRMAHRRAIWWLGSPVMVDCGARIEWIIAGIWTFWLFFLAVRQTGDDYLHLTKRFGIVAASQLPIHYLLSVKSASFPLSALTRLSYEELNPYHRMLGRILIFFFFLHATFYLNFYALSGLLAKKLRDRVVILGLLAITSFLIIGLTSLAKVRNWNYRLFFFIHVALSSVLLPILYFHVSHIRIYIWETAAVYVLNVVLRTINTKVYTTTISMVQGTSLIKMTIPSPTSCDRLAAGQHVYLQPPSTTSYSPLNRLRLHPFTVASLPSEDNTVTLVARQLSGTTHYLANLTKGRSERDIQLAVEGPYGAAANFPDFSTYERILLVAGGVGATFTVPIYRRLLQAISLKGQSTRKVRFLWAVRSMTETSWALEGKAATEMRQKAEIYLTHSGASSDPAGISEDAEDGGESVEMQEREQLLDDEDAVETGAKVTRCGRPDLRRIVDEVFRQGEAERVAVLVCGPPGLGSSLRTHVGRWVFRGRDVFWHAEEFGW